MTTTDLPTNRSIPASRKPTAEPHLVSIFDRAAWALFRPAIALLRRSDRIDGAALGTAAWALLRSRRREAMQNFALCAGADAETVARESFRAFGRTLVEALRLPRVVPAVMWRDPDALAPILREHRPAIILSGHLGNWEAAAWAIQQRAAHAGTRLHLIVAPPSNPLTAQYADSLRREWGVTPHHRADSLRPIVRALMQGDLVGTAADQYPGRDAVQRGDVFHFPFHGRETAFTRTMFRLSERTGAPIVALAAIRTERGFDIFTERIANGSAQEMCRAWVAALERFIREYPGQYLWMHRRWKNEP
jgi:Kdo2-lipid IVA lauroyltransferase/acyltransferase